MKKILTFVYVCCAGAMIGATAQQRADIKVSYVEKYKNHVDFPLQKKFVLYANSEMSKFCDPIGEYVDSLCSTAKGKHEYTEMLTKAIESGGEPMSPSSELCVFQASDKEVIVFDESGGEKCTYSEPWDEMVWEVGDSVRNIMGYECVMATTGYHGREWIAWFTPEVPLPYGPWKFRGLPGLVLAAEDSKGKYLFEAYGIVTSNKEISPLYGKDEYAQENRKEMLKSDRFILENPYAYLAALTGMSLQELGYDGETSIEIPADWDFLETDYR